MAISKSTQTSLGWKKSFLWLGISVACFHIAYASLRFPAAALFVFGYAIALICLADQPTTRRAFYFCLAAGVLCVAPESYFFWKIFNAAAIVLWLILAFWIGLFGAIVCASIRRLGRSKSAWLVPVIWTGLEYFRSELYYLKFSWLNIGYVFSNFQIFSPSFFGMYGIGFVVVAIASATLFLSFKKACAVVLVCVVLAAWSNPGWRIKESASAVSLAGIQLEFPPPGILPQVLDFALKKNPDAQIFVLSEYTLDGGVPESLRNWCRRRSRFVVVGGKDFVTNEVYYNTAFVISTNGETVFKQAKSVPIQFFKDGLPAPGQDIWNSPWGKIGFCICYDLSYTRVYRRACTAWCATFNCSNNGCGRMGSAST